MDINRKIFKCRAYSIGLLLIFFLGGVFLSSCSNNGVFILKSKSTFLDYYVIEDKVYFLNRIVIENSTTQNAEIKIVGISDEDVSTGLLKESTIKGYFYKDDVFSGINKNTISVENLPDTLVVEGNTEKTYGVRFEGNYAGTHIKADRLPFSEYNIEILN